METCLTIDEFRLFRESFERSLSALEAELTWTKHRLELVERELEGLTKWRAE